MSHRSTLEGEQGNACVATLGRPANDLWAREYTEIDPKSGLILFVGVDNNPCLALQVFQAGEYSKSSKFYTKAISYCPKNHVLYSNRSRSLFGKGTKAIILPVFFFASSPRFCA